MRKIGLVDSDARARNFGDYLFVQGIENQIEAENDGSWAVWIHREEDLERGRALLANYLANPADPRFQNNAQAAEEMREQKKREQTAYEKRVKERRHLFRPLATYGFGPLTFLMIFISVIVFIEKNLHGSRILDNFFLTDVDLKNISGLSVWQALVSRVAHFNILLPEVRSGEVWRLVTPIFLHFDFLHIFFNMLWLRTLGSMVEARQGSGWFVILVFVFAAISNVAQYLVSGSNFGGMSGVNFALGGYIWIRGKFDPGSGLFLDTYTVTMMIIMFFACLIGFEGGRIANTAHAAGLLAGMAWGYLSSLRRR